MQHIVNSLEEMKCDTNYPIVASYTYDDNNLKKLIEMTDKKYHPQINVKDNLTPVIACHWGPNAFGYIFASKE